MSVFCLLSPGVRLSGKADEHTPRVYSISSYTRGGALTASSETVSASVRYFFAVSTSLIAPVCSVTRLSPFWTLSPRRLFMIRPTAGSISSSFLSLPAPSAFAA